MTAETIRDRFHDPRLRAKWETTLSGWTEGSEFQRAELMRWVRDQAEALVTLAEDAGDEDEVSVAVGLRFIETMMQGQMLDAQRDYQLARQGSCDPVLVLKRALLRTVTDVLAGLVSTSEMARIEAMLVQPLARAA